MIVAILGILAGFGTASILHENTPGDTSPEAGFARDMSGHHAQAVEIAMLGYGRASAPQLRTFGYDIALTQQAQIGMMSAWLDEWHLQPTGSEPRMAWMTNGGQRVTDNGLMPGMASPEELNALRAATGQAFDIMFCQLMIRHHLGGIHMVDGIIGLSDNDAIRSLAQAMKTGQQKEVAICTNFLEQAGAKPL